MEDITIPKGYDAKIEGDKVIFERKNEEEVIREEIISLVRRYVLPEANCLVPGGCTTRKNAIAYLERQKSTLNKSEIDFADIYSKGVWEKLMSKFKNTKGYYIGCNDVSDIVLNAILDSFKWVKDRWNAAEERKPKMIQWTGKNLKEVIDFTGKSPRFDEWFKSWEDFENYVHSHGDILKLFCEDGSHYEVPVGAWIIKTPDGFNTPSHFRFIQKPAEWNEEDEKMLAEVIDSLSDYESLILYDSSSTSVEHLQKEISWLKSRHHNWKPSEQEKGALSTAIHVLTEERSFPKAAAQLQNILNAFEGKGSHKNWKPSKEQLAALERSYRACYRDDICSLDDGYQLRELYNKLIEVQ